MEEANYFHFLWGLVILVHCIAYNRHAIIGAPLGSLRETAIHFVGCGY